MIYSRGGHQVFVLLGRPELVATVHGRR
jgi:hypothetical protein